MVVWRCIIRYNNISCSIEVLHTQDEKCTITAFVTHYRNMHREWYSCRMEEEEERGLQRVIDVGREGKKNGRKWSKVGKRGQKGRQEKHTQVSVYWYWTRYSVLDINS